MPFNAIRAEWKNWLTQGAQWTGNTIKNQWLGCSVAIGGCWYIHQLHKQNHQQLAQQNAELKQEINTLTQAVARTTQSNEVVTENLANLCSKKFNYLNSRMQNLEYRFGTLESETDFLKKHMVTKGSIQHELFKFDKNLRTHKKEINQYFDQKWLQLEEDFKKLHKANQAEKLRASL